MEFSGQADCVGQALLLLCASGNGRGGGDLHTDRVSHEEARLIGSWAGDRIVVAGDYMDKWLFVPEDLKGLPYTWQQPRYDGSGKIDTMREVFGKRGGDDHGETLYSAARAFFEDISDKVMAVAAKADTPYHPWAAVDTADDGWRTVPQCGILPEMEPKQPIGGTEAWEAYKKHAKPYGNSLVDDLAYHLKRHPGERDRLAVLLVQKLKDLDG